MIEHVKRTTDDAKKLFGEKQVLDSYFQESALLFYPERATFTSTPYVGQRFCENLSSGASPLMRRDFGNLLSAMLRPSTKEWFKLTTSDEPDYQTQVMLDQMQKSMRREMYRPKTRFVSSLREADHDYATFGQAALTVEMNYRTNCLLYRTWHLKDMAWRQDETGEISHVYRKDEMTAFNLNRRYKGNVSQHVKAMLVKDPNAMVKIMHCVMPAEQWKDEISQPYASVIIESDSQHVLFESGATSTIYVIPRWQTVSGTQYAHSPCVTAGLAEARTLQAISLMLLEAGEWASNPTWLATDEVVGDTPNIYPGGVTFVDPGYDQRTGSALQPLTIDSRGLPYGMQMQENSIDMLNRAWFLDRINLPSVAASGEMTAYETQQRVSEYIRNALPLFEVMEHDYSAKICARTHQVLMENGRFGEQSMMPEAMMNSDSIVFEFETPLSEAMERMKVNQFAEVLQIGSGALGAGIDTALDLVDMEGLLKEAYEGTGIDTKYMRDEYELAAMKQQKRNDAEQAQILDTMQKGGQAAGSMAQGMQQMQGAGLL